MKKLKVLELFAGTRCISKEQANYLHDIRYSTDYMKIILTILKFIEYIVI